MTPKETQTARKPGFSLFSGRNHAPGDFWGALAAMLVALPAAIAFGVTIYAAIGPAYAAYGALAGVIGATVVGLVAAGETVETVASEYQLTLEQVRAALAYAAHVASHLPPAVRQAS